MKYYKTYDVIVIGAGAAGIACLRELVNRGYKEVLCLEALNEPGGRIRFNKKFGDIGAMALHLPNKLLGVENLNDEFWGAAGLLNFAKKNGFGFYRESTRPVFRLYKNGQRIKDAFINQANASINNAIENTVKKISRNELPKDISLKDALADLLEDDICHSLITTIYSSTDSGLDAADIPFIDYINTMPSNPGLYPEDGMGTLFKSYAREVRNYISLNKEVVSVRNEDGRNRIEFIDTENGTRLEVYAKMLVITVSIGVLQSWIKEKRILLAKEKIRTINNIKMGYLNKNILKMEETFFTDNHIRTFTHINIRSNRLHKDANFLAVKMYDGYFLINFVGGKKSLEYEKYGTAYARNDTLKILSSVFGNDVYDFCLDSYLSQWNKDKYFHGSYSAAVTHDIDSRLELSKPLAKNIYRAGEEVRYSADEFSYHTHISGALNSGIMAANQVIKDLEH